MSLKQWISPFMKQCFVTTGVSLNFASSGMVMGYSAGLLEQLRKPDSVISVDDSSASWIAAMPGISLFIGNFFAVPIMEKFGRKTANLMSIIPMIVGWVSIIYAPNIHLLLLARFLQGICMGMCATIGPLLIGEYTTPRNRGAFLMTISVSISLAVLFVHALGLYAKWKTAAAVCASIAAVDLAIVLCSPESPTWLAEQRKFDESKRVFRWLRDNEDERELERMIDASIVLKKTKCEVKVAESLSTKFQKNVAYFNETIKKSEFYKPVIIMVHMYILSQWSGVNIIVAYATDLLKKIVSEDTDVPFMVLTLDSQRIVSNVLAVYVIKKVKRRTMLFVTVGINIAAYIATAGYSYAKENSILVFDHPLIGVILTHCLMFAIATGTLPLCFIIAGEIFPLEYKNLAGGITVIFYSINMFLSFKTVPYFFSKFGVYGTYGINSLILSYCLWVAWLLLPETKDRTLQDIEDEFKGRSPEELKSVQSLTSWKGQEDRRCSTPTLV